VTRVSVDKAALEDFIKWARSNAEYVEGQKYGCEDAAQAVATLDIKDIA